MFELLIEAFVLGLIGGAIPGPILTGTFAEILNSGFLRGLRVVFYALIAETIGALLALFVIYSLGLSDVALKIISVAGVFVLFWLAWNIWRIKEIGSGKGKILSFSKIIILTVFNSGYWIFWITVGIPKALILDKIIFGGKFIFLGIFELAWLLITAALAFIFFQFRPLLHRKNLIGVTFKMFSLLLILLAIKTLLNVF
jgi:threonine/homoserine/homoserine lactone efflux protein